MGSQLTCPEAALWVDLSVVESRAFTIGVHGREDFDIRVRIIRFSVPSYLNKFSASTANKCIFHSDNRNHDAQLTIFWREKKTQRKNLRPNFFFVSDFKDFKNHA